MSNIFIVAIHNFCNFSIGYSVSVKLFMIACNMKIIEVPNAGYVCFFNVHCKTCISAGFNHIIDRQETKNVYCAVFYRHFSDTFSTQLSYYDMNFS